MRTDKDTIRATLAVALAAVVLSFAFLAASLAAPQQREILAERTRDTVGSVTGSTQFAILAGATIDAPGTIAGKLLHRLGNALGGDDGSSSVIADPFAQVTTPTQATSGSTSTTSSARPAHGARSHHSRPGRPPHRHPAKGHDRSGSDQGKGGAGRPSKHAHGSASTAGQDHGHHRRHAHASGKSGVHKHGRGQSSAKKHHKKHRTQHGRSHRKQHGRP